MQQGLNLTLHTTADWQPFVNLKHVYVGQFGEGAKVEINRLTQEDCTVTYCTGNAVWVFEQLVTPGCSIPELHVKVQPGRDLYDFVSITVVAKSSYKGRLLEEERFLLFQGAYAKIASVPSASRYWSGMELLLDESIFVTMAPTYKEFGINYTGKQIPYLGGVQCCYTYCVLLYMVIEKPMDKLT